jgi:hypothetical protein
MAHRSLQEHCVGVLGNGCTEPAEMGLESAPVRVAPMIGDLHEALLAQRNPNSPCELAIRSDDRDLETSAQEEGGLARGLDNTLLLAKLGMAALVFREKLPLRRRVGPERELAYVMLVATGYASKLHGRSCQRVWRSAAGRLAARPLQRRVSRLRFCSHCFGADNCDPLVAEYSDQVEFAAESIKVAT